MELHATHFYVMIVETQQAAAAAAALLKMYVGFTKQILFAIAIGAAQTPTAIASSSSSSSSGSGTTATDLIISDANGNINIIGNRLLQDEDTTCVCSPRTYTFKFNYSGTCPGNIDNEGVAGVPFCFVSGPSGVVDLTPVEITAVIVQEFDSNNNVLNQQDYNGPFSDGDTIQYTSISDALDPNVSLSGQQNQNKVPKAIRVTVVGRNQAGQGGILNLFLVGYTLSCEVEPIASGDQIGWTEISGYEPAIPAFCSAVTYAPTVTPSEAPTESPTTAAPTVTPSEAPIESPTFNSMSYHSASFSVSHAKTAKSKAVKAKGGKISKRT